jgi:hypothetical protein
MLFHCNKLAYSWVKLNVGLTLEKAMKAENGRRCKALPPGERPGTHCRGNWVGPRDSLEGIRTPERPARSKLLWLLRYHGALLFWRSKERSESEVKEAKANIRGISSTLRLIGAECVQLWRDNNGGVSLDHSSKETRQAMYVYTKNGGALLQQLVQWQSNWYYIFWVWVCACARGCESVRVALVIQYAMRIRYTVICDLPSLTTFSHVIP